MCEGRRLRSAPFALRAHVAVRLVAFGTLAGLASLVWMTRAYANVGALAPRHHRHWTGWAWLGWLVPIMNLFRPKQIANDIWRSRLGRRAAGVAAGLVAAVDRHLDRRPDRGPRRARHVAEFRTFDLAFAGLSALTVVTGVLFILFIRRSTAMQDERAARLPDDDDRDRIQRPAAAEEDEDREDGFTIEPAWAPSERLGS